MKLKYFAERGINVVSIFNNAKPICWEKLCSCFFSEFNTHTMCWYLKKYKSVRTNWRSIHDSLKLYQKSISIKGKDGSINTGRYEIVIYDDLNQDLSEDLLVYVPKNISESLSVNMFQGVVRLMHAPEKELIRESEDVHKGVSEGISKHESEYIFKGVEYVSGRAFDCAVHYVSSQRIKSVPADEHKGVSEDVSKNVFTYVPEGVPKDVDKGASKDVFKKVFKDVPLVRAPCKCT